jgi:hypothetical protein
MSLKTILHAAPQYDYLKKHGFVMENTFTEKEEISALNNSRILVSLIKLE